MEIKDFSAVQLAMCACSGIMALSVTTKDDPKSNSQLTFSLQAVKEVLDNLEKAQRDKNADMRYWVEGCLMSGECLKIRYQRDKITLKMIFEQA